MGLGEGDGALQGHVSPPRSEQSTGTNASPLDRKHRQHVHMFGIRAPKERERERGLARQSVRRGVVPPTCRCGPPVFLSPPAFCLCQHSNGGSRQVSSWRVVSERLIGCRDDREAASPPPTPSCLCAMLSTRLIETQEAVILPVSSCLRLSL